MNKPNTKLIVFLIAGILVGVLVALVVFGRKNTIPQQQPVTTATSTDQVATTTSISTAGWETTTNDKYGYSFNHPTNAQGSPLNYEFYVQSASNNSKKDFASYAYALWQQNKNYKNSSVTNIVSDLNVIKVSGRTAYMFTSSQAFVLEQSQSLLSYPMVIIVAENQKHDLFLIQYPAGNKVSEKILTTVVIDAKLIAPKVAPSNWQPYSNPPLGFSFAYPANIFTKDTSIEAAPTSYVFAARGRRGSISMQVLNSVLDKNNIQDMYGRIEDPKEVSIGGKTGYAFFWGDAGCGARRVDVPVDYNTKTLRISFGACDEDLYPVNADLDLQTLILKTFIFTK